MDYNKWFSERLTQLRLEKGVSARDMSLSLGQSESYINKIENGRTMPSMSGFFFICEYFGIEPRDFFDPHANSPQTTNSITSELAKLPPQYAEHVLQLVKDLNRDA